MANWLRARGWIVASLRHSKGAGDLLAIAVDGRTKIPLSENPRLICYPSPGDVWLIEVKACKELWQQFRREDRQAMRDTPLPPSGKRWVCNKQGKELIWVAEKDWPPNDHRAGKPDQKDVERGEELAKEHGWR